MASVNKVILVGNCGRDPEVRYLPSGQAVANVSVATSSKRKDRNTDKTTGVEKNTVDIIATELQLLGGREGMGAPSGGGEEGGYSRAPAAKPAAAPAATGAKAPAKGGFDDMDDDIPF